VGEGEGGGASAPERIKNRLQHRFLIAQHIVVPKPQDAETFRVKPSGSRFIIGLRVSMLPAIDLDDQSLRKAREVGDVSSNGSLAAKPEACELLSPQEIPEPSFGIGQLLAQIACGLNRHSVTVQGRECSERVPHPLPNPPPSRGRGYNYNGIICIEYISIHKPPLHLAQ
jgi:hypothetical protein